VCGPFRAVSFAEAKLHIPRNDRVETCEQYETNGDGLFISPLPLLAAHGGVKAAGSPQSIIILVTIKNVQTRRRRALASRRESASDLAASLRHQSFSVLRIVDAHELLCSAKRKPSKDEEFRKKMIEQYEVII